ncbi:hypothetical protein [Arthrobacter rhombi]
MLITKLAAEGMPKARIAARLETCRRTTLKAALSRSRRHYWQN